jgi:hypothetical protein
LQNITVSSSNLLGYSLETDLSRPSAKFSPTQFLTCLLRLIFTCKVAGEAVNVDLEEEVRIEGEHVEEVVEDGAEYRHPRVHHQEEGQHLQRAPQRL